MNFAYTSQDKENIHVLHVSICDSNLGCMFNLPVDQALEFYPEAMEAYTLF